MSVDLLTNRKRLNEISVSFCISLKYDKRNLEVDVTSYVDAVARIDFLCENIALFIHDKYT